MNFCVYKFNAIKHLLLSWLRFFVNYVQVTKRLKETKMLAKKVYT